MVENAKCPLHVHKRLSDLDTLNHRTLS